MGSNSRKWNVKEFELGGEGSGRGGVEGNGN
jgi:hypothetical protein